MNEIRLYKSKKKAYKLLLLCAPFILIGFWMVVVDSTNWIGWLSLLFFGVSIPIVIKSLIDKRPQIIINEIGVFDRTILKEFINWEVIHDAYILTINNQKFICLKIDEKYSPSLKKGLVYKFLTKANKFLGAQELNLNLSMLEKDEYKLNGFIRLMIDAEKLKKDNLKVTVNN